MRQCVGNKKISSLSKGRDCHSCYHPFFMSGSLQNTLSGTPAVALIPYLYNGSSRAASSFSMPGSEAIFHGFVCAPSHRVELSLPASFMYSSLHCLYEVEANIHPQRICVKSFYSKWAERCGAWDRNLRIQWSLQVVKGGYVSHGSRRMPPKLCIQHQLFLQPE